MERRNVKSLNSIVNERNIIGVFASAYDTNLIELDPSFTSASLGSKLFELWIDRRKPQNSIEVYFTGDEEEYKNRCEEQTEFDKVCVK